MVKIKTYNYLEKTEEEVLYTDEAFILQCRHCNISWILNSAHIDEYGILLALAYFKYRQHTPFYQEYQSRRAR